MFKEYTDAELQKKQDKLDRQCRLAFDTAPKSLAKAIHKLHFYKTRVKNHSWTGWDGRIITNTYDEAYKDPTYIVKQNDKLVKQRCGNCRSVEDTYRLCKYYFPDITYKEVYNIMTKIRKAGQLDAYWCYTTSRRVHNAFKGNVNQNVISKIIENKQNGKKEKDRNSNL